MSDYRTISAAVIVALVVGAGIGALTVIGSMPPAKTFTLTKYDYTKIIQVPANATNQPYLNYSLALAHPMIIQFVNFRTNQPLSGIVVQAENGPYVSPSWVQIGMTNASGVVVEKSYVSFNQSLLYRFIALGSTIEFWVRPLHGPVCSVSECYWTETVFIDTAAIHWVVSS